MSEVLKKENVEEANTFIIMFYSLTRYPDACRLILSASLEFTL